MRLYSTVDGLDQGQHKEGKKNKKKKKELKRITINTIFIIVYPILIVTHRIGYRVVSSHYVPEIIKTIIILTAFCL